jgi:type I restriction enzyme R subunit
MSEPEFHLFDRDADVEVVERRLPHWAQAGTVCFITFRTWDSIPKPVLERWLEDRRQWLERHGIQGSHRVRRSANWRSQLERLDPQHQHEFHETFSNRWHAELDNCHGACVLRQPELALIVADSLKYFDGERYDLTDFVVMPTHVHLLAAFRNEKQMLAQCESWKHYTATEINRRMNQKGRFWQQDGFDHLVRSADQFEYLRRYIAENASKARLREGQFIHESKTLK